MKVKVEKKDNPKLSIFYDEFGILESVTTKMP